ncbi:hypothetical protein A2210_00940 [Candidatus Woesebacteria bacterium RIFOXYA1_FULL_40_18]|uniref:NlpC/P60 domain-containing protein n=1 Tax=Candidatus Woesebacteria bacterium RIFOXYA1_FULL_40_18 TaxID=1802532 RepID=A0A1F8CJ81_9BACT|nr:MAG: hypothetical protein A2210_00940 [Candidatus Woesebacteria bacterium RIFOXYA1_FULL_40_18]
MAINPEILSLLDLPYNFGNGPDVKNVSPKDGVNCQQLTHMILATLFQIRLPTEMRSKEFYEDQKYFTQVLVKEATIGDVFIFGRPEENDYRKLHLAVFIGQDSDGSALLIHANGVDKQVSLWPLDKFSQHPRYEKLYAVKRLKQPK